MKWTSLPPRTSRRGRLLAASIVWSAVGAGLTVAGAVWALRAPAALSAPLLAGGVAIGWAKGRLVLAPMARRNAARILDAPDSAFVGSAFAVRAWALAAGFMALGAGLRRSALPRPWLGLIYLAAGSALLLGARASWAVWRREGGTAREDHISELRNST